MPNDKMDKYEEEIRDILNRMDDFIPEGSSRQEPKPQKRQQPKGGGWTLDFRRRLYTYNSSSFLMGTVLFAIAAAILTKVYQPFGMIAALLSVGCLLIAITLPMISRGYGRPEKRWRGRLIEMDSYRANPSPSWRQAWWRIKRFFGWR